MSNHHRVTWSVRVSPELRDDLAEFCALNAVSVQAVIESLVTNLVEQHIAEGRETCVEDYDVPPGVRERFAMMMGRARSLDVERRRRMGGGGAAAG